MTSGLYYPYLFHFPKKVERGYIEARFHDELEVNIDQNFPMKSISNSDSARDNLFKAERMQKWVHVKR